MKEYCGVPVNDLDCYKNKCPQKLDGEPKKTGRACPLESYSDDD